MPRTNNSSANGLLARLRTGRLPLFSAFVCVISGLFGCVPSAYEQIQLGELWPKRANLLPAGTAIRTSFGVVQSSKGMSGDQESLVVFVDSAERITAKFDAVSKQGSALRPDTPRFHLRGEIDRQTSGFGQTGPMDILRSLADTLTNNQDAIAAREAQHTVAAGLVRILQSWPGKTDEGPAYSHLLDALDRVPAGGAAQSGVSERGMLLFSYTAR